MSRRLYWTVEEDAVLSTGLVWIIESFIFSDLMSSFLTSPQEHKAYLTSNQYLILEVFATNSHLVTGLSGRQSNSEIPPIALDGQMPPWLCLFVCEPFLVRMWFSRNPPWQQPKYLSASLSLSSRHPSFLCCYLRVGLFLFISLSALFCFFFRQILLFLLFVTAPSQVSVVVLAKVMEYSQMRCKRLFCRWSSQSYVDEATDPKKMNNCHCVSVHRPWNTPRESPGLKGTEKLENSY